MLVIRVHQILMSPGYYDEDNFVDPIFKFLNSTDNPIDIHNDERTDSQWK